jgi:hypothetical protein
MSPRRHHQPLTMPAQSSSAHIPGNVVTGSPTRICAKSSTSLRLRDCLFAKLKGGLFNPPFALSPEIQTGRQ